MALPEGIRAFFPFKPDWKSPVEETFEYKTDILRSRNMTGQWRGLRSKPRLRMQYTAQLTGEAAARFNYRMTHSQPYTWLVPQWARGRRLASAVVISGQTLVLSEPVSYLAKVGDEYLLVSDDLLTDPEVVVIDTISVDRMTLTIVDPLASNWSKGSNIYPAWRCLVGGESNAEWITSKVLQVQMIFRRLVDNKLPVDPTLTADFELDGLEVLTRRLNWSSPVSASFQWLPEYIDSELGPFSSVVNGVQKGEIRQGQILCTSRDEVDWWLAFLMRRKGARVPFKMPTWLGDLPLHEPVNTAFDFEVSTVDLGRFSPNLNVYSHIMVLKKDGSLAFFEISSFTPDFVNDVTIVNTIEAWAEAYGPWECRLACFVNNVHLDSDGFSVSWITDTVARINMTVRAEEVL